MTEMQSLWAKGRSVEAWADATTPDETLIWGSGHPSQAQKLLALSCLLGLECRIIGAHRSKSVGLPVAMFKAEIWGEEEIYFVTRDNFHDLKLVVGSSFPLDLPLDVVHAAMTEEELDAQKKRSYEYSKGFDDFDPSDYEGDKWFDDWGGDSLIRTDDGKIYRCSSVSPCYYEGMEEAGIPPVAFQRYEPGRTQFATAVKGSYVELQVAVQAIIHHAQKFVMDRREREGAA